MTSVGLKAVEPFRHDPAKHVLAGLEIVDIAVNDIDRAFLRELVRPVLTRRPAPAMRGEIPYYGDVMVYGLRKRPAGG